eukprot:7345274-Karenia_brevis.AAC.1
MQAMVDALLALWLVLAHSSHDISLFGMDKHLEFFIHLEDLGIIDPTFGFVFSFISLFKMFHEGLAMTPLMTT